MHETKKGKEKMSNAINRKYFGHQNPLFLVKILLKANHIKDNQVVNQPICSMNELKKSLIG